MGPHGVDTSIILGPFAQVLLDAAKGPKLGATGPTHGAVDKVIDSRSGPVLPVGVGCQALGRVKPHVTFLADVSDRMDDKWVSKRSYVLTSGLSTPI
jgi:hypothetical protein